MNFENLTPDSLRREAPPSEKLAKRFLNRRAIGDSQTEKILQRLIEEVYNEVTASLTHRPPVGQISNAVRGELLMAIDREDASDVTPYFLSNLTKRAVRKAVKRQNEPS